MAHPVPTKAFFLQPSPEVAMMFAPFGASEGCKHHAHAESLKMCQVTSQTQNLTTSIKLLVVKGLNIFMHVTATVETS